MTNYKDFNYFMKYEYYVVDVEDENKLAGTVQGSTCFPFLPSKWYIIAGKGTLEIYNEFHCLEFMVREVVS